MSNKEFPFSEVSVHAEGGSAKWGSHLKCSESETHGENIFALWNLAATS